MSDVFFEYAFQPSLPSEHVARMAVLYRLHHLGSSGVKCPKTPEIWDETLSLILGLWRRRLSELCNRGVPRFASHQVSRSRNCHPWGIAVKPYAREVVYCHRNDICPWCFGRSVSEIYTLFRRILRPGDSVMAITHVDSFSDFSLDYLRRKLDCGRKTMCGLIRANKEVRAAYWLVTAEPPANCGPTDVNFRVRCRLLMLLPVTASAILVPESPGWKTERVHEPDEKRCQRLMARLCAYPTRLLTGTVENVQKVLVAKKGSAIVGDFGGPPWAAGGDRCTHRGLTP